MIKTLFVSSATACFELINDNAYYSPEKNKLILNGKTLEKEWETNIFSLFDLTPDTLYKLQTTGGEEISFTTARESVCINVVDFGAKGDGTTDDTEAIQGAIDMCLEGGRVLIPEGTYCIKPLVLRSHITFYLCKGARLQASTNVADYPVMPGEIDDCVTKEKFQCSTWEGSPNEAHKSVIGLYRLTDVIIAGEGTIDGNAQNAVWWINPKQRKASRPRLFFASHCSDITLHGITVCNSPSWTIHPYFTKNFKLLDARVNAPKDSPNTDGCNPESCNEVQILGTIISVGDDCIAIKSGKRYMGDKYQAPAQKHTIRNCLMQFGHGAVVLGSEMSGGVKDLEVNRCVFNKTDRGLRIKTRRGRGKNAVIDNVVFENIEMRQVGAPLVINMFYFCDVDGKTEYVWSKEKLPVDDGTPYLGNFFFKNIRCVDCHQAAGYFYGLPEQPIESVTIEDCSFAFDENAVAGTPAMMSFIEPCKKMGFYFNNVRHISLSNVVLDGIEGERVQAVNFDTINEQ